MDMPQTSVKLAVTVVLGRLVEGCTAGMVSAV